MRTACRSHAATTAAFTRRARGLEHHRVRVGERARDVVRSADAPVVVEPGVVAVDRGGDGGCRNHGDHGDPLALQPSGEIAAVRLVDRDDDPHWDAPDVGTTERAD